MNRDKLLYSKTHEWVSVEIVAGGKVATVGITDFALEALTDLVHIELPKSGQQLKAGQPLGEVESVKAVSDLYSPVDGQVTEVHTQLIDNLEKLTADPFGEGWLVKIKVSDEAGLAKLMDRAGYEKQVAEEGH